MPLEVKLIEPPALKLVYESDDERFAFPTVRTHNPKIQVQILSSAIRALPDVNVDVFDMKTLGKNETPYRTIDYEGKRIECSRIGADFSDLEEEIRGADVVCVTSIFTQTAGIVAEFGRFVKRVNPNVELIVGGFDTVTPEREKFYRKNGFDTVIATDGEIALPNHLISKYHLKQSLMDTPIRFSLPLPDLDRINYRGYTEVEDGRLPEGASLPIGYLVTSKGCNRSCDFCTVPDVNGKYRTMDLDEIDALLRHYRSYGISTLLHAESNTLARLRSGESGRMQLVYMFRLMRDYGFAWEFFDGIEFGLLANDGRVNEELVRLLFNPELKEGELVGGYRAYIPMEDLAVSGKSRYAKMPKYETQKDILRAIIDTGVDMLSFGVIIGYPNETAENLEQKRRELHDLKDWVGQVSNGRTNSLFILYIHSTFPGSLDYRRYKDQLVYGIEDYPELFQLYTACKPSASFSPLELTLKRRQLDYELNGAKINQEVERTGRPPMF